MALRAAVRQRGVRLLLAAAATSRPQRCLRSTSVAAEDAGGAAGGDLHKLSHGVDGLELWAADTDSGRGDPGARGCSRAAFGEVFAFLEERGVEFSDVAEWGERKRKALLDQVFPSDPLAAHSALQEWAERVEQGRLQPVNDGPQRSKESYQLWRLEGAAAAGDAEQVKKTLVVLVRGLRLEMRQLARPFAEVCKSRSLSKEARADIAARLEQLYADEQSVRFNLKMYTSMLLTCEDYTAVRSLFRRMRQQGIVPDTFAYSAAMKASEDSPGAVENLFDNMLRASLTPTGWHYYALLRSLGFALQRAAEAQQEQGGRDEGAVAAARRRLWDAWRRLKSRAKPSRHSYAIMVRSVASELAWVRALDAQPEKKDKPESLGRPLVDYEVRALASVEELLVEALRVGVATHRVFTYHVQAQPTLQGRLDALTRYLTHLKGCGKRLSVPRQLIRAVGNHQRAQEVVQEFARRCPQGKAAGDEWTCVPSGKRKAEQPLEKWVVNPRARHPENEPKAAEGGSACDTLWALMEEAEASYDRQRAPPSPS